MNYEKPEIEHSERIDHPLVVGTVVLGMTVAEDSTNESLTRGPDDLRDA
jgi:hypothetical protein